ncbi:hypothetical protein OESDEN_01465 [Oesophagostomum dentatum]|uniref:Uncharacterized protein n=1 Tax=Oesophagostomum dentatum TaxID=61180 RepID=A0A0B1TRU8_OESDE|nr:hypothetical protein OESDEN_01465 [Oesophagostomum dentatum]
MRMKLSDLEDSYRRIVDMKWADHLSVIKHSHALASAVSFTFADDLNVVDDFFTEAHAVASRNVLFDSPIRVPIPAMPRQIELAISRLLSDIRTYDQPVLKSLKSKADGSVNAGFPYDSKFVRALLKDVHMLLIGDSRMFYLHSVASAVIDILPLENDRVFRQAREYHTNYYLIQYLFTTRVMKMDIETALLELCTAGEFPDVVLINSCLWDITRYSRAFEYCIPPNVNRQAAIERASLEEYLERISMLIRRLRLIMPATTQVIWINMPWPLTVDSRSITNRADNADIRHLNRMLIVDANFRASQLFRAAGYDVLDIAFYMRNQALYAYRVKDGVHWDPIGTRIMSQLVIGHLARSWNIPLPQRIKQKLTAFSEDAHTYDLSKSWAIRSLAGFDSSTFPEEISRNGSFPEILQRRIRAAVLREIKEKDPKLYEALRSDIRTMRLCKILDENPGIGERISLEGSWDVDEMIKSFPKVGELGRKVVPQEVTVLVNEEAVASRKRKHSPDRR